MINKIIIGICMVLLLITPAYAMTKAYESTSVSRVVGDNPDDLIKQLERDNMYVTHATSHINDKWYQLGMGDVNKIIEEGIFEETIREGSINLSNLDSDVSNFRKNELFVLAPDYNEVMNYEGITPNSISSWENYFRDKQPLVIFDARYAGMYLPKKDSFVKRLSKYATMIAPMSYSSKEMVKAIVCNLRDSRGIGDSFRVARNNYYWGTEANEPIGLTMLSYELYGDPTNKVYISGYSQNIIDKYCEDYNEPYKKNSEIRKTLLAGVNNNIRVTYEINIDNYRVEDIGNYEVINFDDAIQKTDNYEVVLPQIIHQTELPLKTIVTNFSATFENPIGLNVNMAGWEEDFVERECNNETKENYAAFAQSYTKDKEIALVYINPVEILSCSEGRVRLYRNVKYWVEYIPYTKILIKNVVGDNKVEPNESVKLTAEIENIGTDYESGKILVVDGGKVLGKKDITLSGGEIKSIELEFSAPDYDGTKIINVVYENNEGFISSQSDFSVKIEKIIDIYAPDPNNPNCPPKCADLDLVVFTGTKDCAIVIDNIIRNHPLCYPSYCEWENESGEIQRRFCLDYCDNGRFYSGGHCFERECQYKTVEENSNSCQYCGRFDESKSLYLPYGDYACYSGYTPEQFGHSVPGESNSVSKNNVKAMDIVCMPEGGGKYRDVIFNSRECGYVDPCENVNCEDACYGEDIYSFECVGGECVHNQLLNSNVIECGYDPCSGVDCSNKCEGFTSYNNGFCVNGQCQYIKEENSKSCGYIDPCENVNCNDKCDGTTRYEQGSCLNGECAYNFVEQKSRECGYDPCTGVNCYNYCEEDDLHSNGKCIEGRCSYGSLIKNAVACINNPCDIIGDTDNNKKIDVFDNLNILGVISGDKVPPANICCYDVSRNGKIEIMDVIEILKIINKQKSPESSSLC